MLKPKTSAFVPVPAGTFDLQTASFAPLCSTVFGGRVEGITLFNANILSAIITMRFDKAANTPYITDVLMTH